MRDDSIDTLVDISSRLDQIEQSAEWISRDMVQKDPCISQTGTLIGVIASDIREKICALVEKLEDTIDMSLN